MTLWIVLLLIAALLSPLVWLLPSRHQRHRMAVRLEARRQGLAMQLLRREWPHWMAELAPNPCPQYHCVRHQRQDDWKYWQVRPGIWVDRWQEQPDMPTELADELQRLPADVFEVEATPGCLNLYWGERDGADHLPAIVRFMKHWS